MKTAAALLLCGLSALAAEEATAAPIIVGTYYEDTALGSGCSSGVCSAIFSPAPAGKQVMSKQIDCLTSGIKLKPFFVLFQIKNTDRFIYPDLHQVGSGNDVNYYHFSYSGPLLYVGNPVVAVVWGQGSDTIFMRCTLIGDLSK